MKKYIFKKNILKNTGVLLIVMLIVLTNVVVSENNLSPPTITITNPHDLDTVGITDVRVPIEVTASDDSGISEVIFKINNIVIGWDNAAPYQDTWDTTTYPDGWYTITATANARDGETASDSINVCLRDCTNHAPFKPNNPSPADSEIDVDTNADLSWIGGDPDFGDTVKYDIYFGTSPASLVMVAEDYPQTTYKPGLMDAHTMYYWKIYAWDNHGAGAKGDVWAFTTLDNPPIVEILSPKDGDTVIGIITITGTASDPDGNNELQKVEVQIDNNGWMTATGTTSWTYKWDTTCYSNKVHKISAQSYDGYKYSIIDEINVEVSNIISDDWPMFHHDNSLRGYSPSLAPKTNRILWIYNLNIQVYSSPAVANGKVYIPKDYKVCCLDANTGAKIWDSTTIGNVVLSSPTVVDGKVYIGSEDKKVYCLDANTGAKIWDYTTGGEVTESSPTVANGKVYIGSFDKKVYCLDANTGAKIWDYTTGNLIYSSPAIADGKVYIGSMDKKVYCLDANTGVKIWDYTIINDIELAHSSPAVADGKVYIDSTNKLHCLDANTGVKIWDSTTGELFLYSSPAVIDGKVYIGSFDKKVYCLDANTGVKIWDYTTGDSIYSSPAIADGKVYIGSFDKKVYCLDANTGVKIWDYTTGNLIYSSPAIADGKVYIGSNDKKVYAFEDDVTPPTCQITRPKEYNKYILDAEFSLLFKIPYVLGKITIQVTATDNSIYGVNNVEFYINNQLKNIDTSPPWEWTCTLGTLFPALWTIKAIAYDDSGNSAFDQINILKFW